MAALCLVAISAPWFWAPAVADDSCEYALDGECDEGRYGGGAFCSDGTDTTDCRTIAETAMCEFAFDYECDEERFGGTGACPAGTDAFDCGILATGRGDDSCPFANDAECDEPRFPDTTGLCRDGSDTSDCGTVDTARSALDTLADLLASGAVPDLGSDDCDFAQDLQCDDARFGGSGLCADGTDATDCRAMAAGGDNSCEFAGDGVCDEPQIGLGSCTSGTDSTDCEPAAFLRNRTNSCAAAFDGQCDEPGQGKEVCDALTDTADCAGRDRPVQAYDHFFGRDDRVFHDAAAMPWRTLGLLVSADETNECSGTLVGPRVVLTAAHCMADLDGNLALPEFFYAGDEDGYFAERARVVRGMIAPDYSVDPAPEGEGNGNDWGIALLDRDIGSILGYLPVHVLTEAEFAQIERGGLIVDQGGFSWDTDDFLSGHVGCRITRSYEDFTVSHLCDTTHGDSGSPILLRFPEGHRVIAVDSQYFDRAERSAAFSSGNLAVDSRAFAAAVREFNEQ